MTWAGQRQEGWETQLITLGLSVLPWDLPEVLHVHYLTVGELAYHTHVGADHNHTLTAVFPSFTGSSRGGTGTFSIKSEAHVTGLANQNLTTTGSGQQWPAQQLPAYGNRKQNYQNMTLSELVDQVCQKSIATTSRRERRQDISQGPLSDSLRVSDLARCDRSSIAVVRTDADQRIRRSLTDENGNILTAGLVDQILILPAICSRVINCRWGNNTVLQNEEMWNQIRLNPRSSIRPEIRSASR